VLTSCFFPGVWHGREDEGVLCLQDHCPEPFVSSTTNSHLHKHVPAFICEELRILQMGTDGWGIQNFPLTLQAQHHASCWIELTVLDWVCASLLLINMGWWGFVLSYEASVVLMQWKRTATESCICCVLMCITKLVKSRQSRPTCNENICNALWWHFSLDETRDGWEVLRICLVRLFSVLRNLIIKIVGSHLY
jgi:hypothetical protein